MNDVNSQAQKIPRVYLVVLAILVIGLAALPFLQGWFGGWIEISAVGADNATIFSVTDDGSYEEIGEGSARFSEGPGEYTFAVRADGKESLRTVTARRFSTTSATISLANTVASTPFLPTQAQNLHANTNGVAYLDPESNRLFLAADQTSLPSRLYQDLSLLETGQWRNIRSAVFTDTNNQLRFIHEGVEVSLFIPANELSENNFSFAGITPVSMNRSGAVAIVLGGTLYYYPDVTSDQPQALRQNVDQNAIIRLSDQGAIAVLERADIDPEEDVVIPDMTQVYVVNSSTGESLGEWILSETDLPLTGQWSPNGAVFLFSTAEGLYALRNNSTELETVTTRFDGLVANIEWLDPLRAAVSIDNTIWLFLAEDSLLQKVHSADSQIHPDGGISFDDGTLYFSTRDPELLSTGELLTIQLP